MFQTQVVSEKHIEHVTVAGDSNSKITTTIRVEDGEDVLKVNKHKDIKASKTVVTDEETEKIPDIQEEETVL